jgi:hypothetical protein
MRVATSGTFAHAQDYGASPATPGLVLTSFGPDAPPDWAPGGGASLRVHAVVFVDAHAPVDDQAGTLDHPFQTLQQGIDYACSNYSGGAIVRVAPEQYAEDLNVPDTNLDVLVIEGWGKEFAVSTALLPRILGNIVVQPKSIAPPLTLCLANLEMQGNIGTADPGAQDFAVQLHSVQFNGGTITANNTQVYLEHAAFMNGCTLSGFTTLNVRTDGYSWGELLRDFTTFNPPDYTRTFYEEGCDYADNDMVENGLAIGASIAVEFPHSTARPGDVGAVTQTTDPGVVDFQLVFSHCTLGSAWFILTNISRVSTNFNDAVRTVVWHMDMPEAPVPD